MMVVYALDGANGTLDPAFDGHYLPLKHWALAWQEGWADVQALEAAYQYVNDKFGEKGNN